MWKVWRLLLFHLYVETTILQSSLPSFGRMFCLVHVIGLLITAGPESFHWHFNAQFTSPHHTFFIFLVWDCKTTESNASPWIIWTLLRLLYYCSMSNANESNAFSEPGRSSNSSSCLQDNSSCALSATAMLQ